MFLLLNEITEFIFIFFKNLEEKIQRCLELLVGDSRLGTYDFPVALV